MKKLGMLLVLFVSTVTIYGQRIDLLQDIMGHGGSINIFDNAGNRYSISEPDFDGIGGYFRITSNANDFGFVVDGNYLGTNDTRVSIFGTTNMVFDASATGNNSAILGIGAISSTEIQNESGVTSDIEDANVALTPGLNSIISHSIDAPTSGYVLVIATGRVGLDHANGAITEVIIGLSEDGVNLSLAQDLDVKVPSPASTGFYYQAYATHAVYNITAGMHTFHLLGSGTAGITNIADINLSCIFIPTNYGTVTANLTGGQNDETSFKNAGVEPAPLATQIKNSEAEALKANQARIEKEMEELKEMVEKLRSEAENNPEQRGE